MIQGKPLLESIKNLPDWVGAECFKGIDEIDWSRDQQGNKTLRIKGTPNHFRAAIKDHFKLKPRRKGAKASKYYTVKEEQSV